MKELFINLILALIWLFLSTDKNLVDLLFGWVLGFAIIAAFHRITGGSEYVRRVLAFAKFVLIFLREFIYSNIHVTLYVLTRSRKSMHPEFVTMDISGLNTGEIVLLSQCITLTPGTTAVEVSEDRTSLLIHMLDPDENTEDHTLSIRRNFLDNILRFTRGNANPPSA